MMFALTRAFFDYFPTTARMVGTKEVLLNPIIEQLQQQIAALGSGSEFQDVAKQQAIYDLLKQQYIFQDKIDVEKMKEYAIKGFVEALGDPYTTYMTIDENKMFDEELEGTQEFDGVGAVVAKKDQGILIEEVLKGSPSFKAWLLPLDLILQIDGTDVQPLSLPEAIKLMRGPKWSTVMFTIFREKEDAVIEVKVTRDTITVPSVRGEMLDISWSKALYVELAVFGEDTKKACKAVMDEYAGQAEGIIIDLRGNGGGYLPMAGEIASFFLPKGDVVTETKYLSYPTETFLSKGYPYFQGKPIVVLVDGSTASASEIVAAALRERGKATLVGDVTFGKGSIQTLNELPDGSLLKYTVGRRYTPDGNHIEDHVGLIPDIEVKFDRQAYLSGAVDNQLEAAKNKIQALINSH